MVRDSSITFGKLPVGGLFNYPHLREAGCSCVFSKIQTTLILHINFKVHYKCPCIGGWKVGSAWYETNDTIVRPCGLTNALNRLETE